MKTQIMKEDLAFLLDTELLEQLDEPQEGLYEFKTTEKGREALSQFYKLVTQFFAKS